MPLVWTTYVGAGPKGWTVTLHVQNDTPTTIHLHSITPKRGLDALRWPPKQGDYNTSKGSYKYIDQEWVQSLRVGREVPPYGSVEFGIVLPTSAANCRAKPCIALSISTTSRIIKKRAIAVPIITPDEHHRA